MGQNYFKFCVMLSKTVPVNIVNKDRSARIGFTVACSVVSSELYSPFYFLSINGRGDGGQINNVRPRKKIVGFPLTRPTLFLPNPGFFFFFFFF